MEAQAFPDDFGDRFTHSLSFGAQLTDRPVRPGIFYIVPLDEDLQDFLDGTLGIKIDLALR